MIEMPFGRTDIKHAGTIIDLMWNGLARVPEAKIA
jgi:hypothetical protein